LNDYKDKYLRKLAEFDNFRKRTQKEKEDLYASSIADVIKKLLPVADNLDLALGACDIKEGPMYDGIVMIKKQLLQTFSDLGVTETDALGCEFDPQIHNAVLHTEDPEAGDNIIVEVMQKGYIHKSGRVIRFAMVKVAN